MVTGKDMVNTGITKTSSLFQEKQSGARHGPGRELMGRGFHMAGLLWFLGRHWAKEHPCWHGCTIYTKIGAGDDVCTCYLLALVMDALVHTGAKKSAILYGYNSTVTYA